MMTWALARAPAIWYVCIPSKHDHPFGWAWLLFYSVNWGSQRLKTTANISPGSGRCESRNFACHLQSYTVPQRFIPQSSTIPSCTLPRRVCYTGPLCYWDMCAHSVFLGCPDSVLGQEWREGKRFRVKTYPRLHTACSLCHFCACSLIPEYSNSGRGTMNPETLMDDISRSHMTTECVREIAPDVLQNYRKKCLHYERTYT